METKDRLLKTPASKDEALAWLNDAVAFFDTGFHPDTPGEDYVESASDEPTFTKKEVRAFEAARAKVFKLIADPYEAAMPAFVKAVEAKGIL